MNINALSYLTGLEFYPTSLMVDTTHVQNKKHKNKRINKKWIKRYGYTTTEKPSDKCYVMGNRITAHPDMIEKIKTALGSNARYT